jgi:ADP-ribosyl-[dinitrogen reductase] hydrolase
MIGAICGDIVGSRFEFSKLRKNKSEHFDLFTDGCEFTDDTVMTIATADAILNNMSFQDAYLKWGNKYPNLSYGSNFKSWLLSSDPRPYNSYGNGSAMRVGPIGWLYDDLESVMQKADESAQCTHNHDEGLKGAVSVAVCIYLARHQTPKKIIKEFVESFFGYDLSRKLSDIRPNYRFDVTCPGSVPESIICFLESDGFEDSIRKAVSLGGDTDTQACIAGSIAEAFYGIPVNLFNKVYTILSDEMIVIDQQFIARLHE